jgi:hypothetical protein
MPTLLSCRYLRRERQATLVNYTAPRKERKAYTLGIAWDIALPGESIFSTFLPTLAVRTLFFEINNYLVETRDGY